MIHRLLLATLCAATASVSALADTSPDPFTLDAQTGVAFNSPRVSWPVWIYGIDEPTPVSISNGTVSVGCTGVFGSGSFMVNAGQRICVQHTSAATPLTTVTSTLTVGDVTRSFSSTTAATAMGSDTVPNPLSFEVMSGVSVNSTSTSQYARITGIDAPTPISVTGGSYSIGCPQNGALATTAPGTVGNEDYVCVVATAAATPGTARRAQLTVGGSVSDFWVVTTGRAPDRPQVDSVIRLPDALINAPYVSPRIPAIVSTAGYTVVYIAGGVQGMRLTGSGQIAGTPDVLGDYGMQVMIVDDAGAVAFTTARVNVVSALAEATAQPVPTLHAVAIGLLALLMVAPAVFGTRRRRAAR